jgi:adenosine/AMP kinase
VGIKWLFTTNEASFSIAFCNGNMAPKRKRVYASKQSEARKILEERYKFDGLVCRKGHVLILYIQNYYPTDTIKAVQEKYGLTPSYSRIVTLKKQVIDKYRNLPSQEEQLKTACDKIFVVNGEDSSSANSAQQN